MKILFSILALFAISLPSFATEWLTYYVYVETGYTQGPWTRAELLGESEYRYLAAEPYEDLFGSGELQLAEKLLARLKSKKPDLYAWRYELSVQGDTVVLTTKDPLKNEETVKNEITATLTFNGFKAVSFRIAGRSETLTDRDLTIPYFDLVSKQPSAEAVPATPEEPAVQKQSDVEPMETKGPAKTWLLISVAANLVLVVLLVRKMTKKGTEA
ncbi:MAG: hypothetical protein IBJ09_15600 [Bacteroidia bacterium]|nr:hypothetical protein [Bacteroidia bacterium]